MRLASLWPDKGLIFPNESGSLFNPSNLRTASGPEAPSSSAELGSPKQTNLPQAEWRSECPPNVLR